MSLSRGHQATYPSQRNLIFLPSRREKFLENVSHVTHSNFKRLLYARRRKRRRIAIRVMERQILDKSDHVTRLYKNI